MRHDTCFAAVRAKKFAGGRQFLAGRSATWLRSGRRAGGPPVPPLVRFLLDRGGEAGGGESHDTRAEQRTGEMEDESKGERVEGPHVLLAGRPGVGKTTVVRRTAERLVEAGFEVAGFYTEETRDERDRRRGFRGVPLAGGQAATIAAVDLEGEPRVSRYGVDVEAVDRLAEEHLDPGDDVDVVLVDEIGKMECLSDLFVDRVRALLDAGRPVLATVGPGGEGFREEVRRRDDVDLWRVTEGNRDALPRQLAERLQEGRTEREG